jgi:hypothetical protein
MPQVGVYVPQVKNEEEFMMVHSMIPSIPNFQVHLSYLYQQSRNGMEWRQNAPNCPNGTDP